MAVAPKSGSGYRRFLWGLGVAVSLTALATATAWAELCGPNHVDRYNPATDRFECIAISSSLRVREQRIEEQTTRQRLLSANQRQLQRDQEALTRQLKAEQRQNSVERRAGQREVGAQRETESRLLDQNQKRLGEQLRLQQKPGS